MRHSDWKYFRYGRDWTLLVCIGTFFVFSTRAIGDPPAQDLIVGSWDPSSAAFYDLPIAVRSAVVTMGRCAPVHYAVIRDRVSVLATVGRGGTCRRLNRASNSGGQPVQREENRYRSCGS
jgi:hypothetical protein